MVSIKYSRPQELPDHLVEDEFYSRPDLTKYDVICVGEEGAPRSSYFSRCGTITVRVVADAKDGELPLNALRLYRCHSRENPEGRTGYDLRFAPHIRGTGYIRLREFDDLPLDVITVVTDDFDLYDGTEDEKKLKEDNEIFSEYAEWSGEFKNSYELKNEGPRVNIVLHEEAGGDDYAHFDLTYREVESGTEWHELFLSLNQECLSQVCHDLLNKKLTKFVIDIQIPVWKKITEPVSPITIDSIKYGEKRYFLPIGRMSFPYAFWYFDEDEKQDRQVLALERIQETLAEIDKQTKAFFQKLSEVGIFIISSAIAVAIVWGISSFFK